VDDGEDDALRAHIRMRLAFWQAQDRRSITAGPAWLWRGRHLAPLRRADLSATTGELIARRQASGMPAATLYGAVGPRQHRLPLWVRRRSTACWAAAAVVLALVAVICARATDDYVGIGAFAGWGAAACAAVALVFAALLLWAHCDPLKLTAAQVDEVNASRRLLEWNPLAGGGPISVGGAYLLEGIAIVSELDRSPAWKLPGVDVMRTRFDADEEIFQIARAAYSLDQHEINRAQLARVAPTSAYVDFMMRTERRHLTEALLGRLLVLHRCVGTLKDLQQRAQRGAAAGGDTADSTFFTAAAENELAAAALDELNTDLLVISDVYDEVGSAPGGPQPHRTPHTL
jgi:hypothetical protein